MTGPGYEEAADTVGGKHVLEKRAREVFEELSTNRLRRLTSFTDRSTQGRRELLVTNLLEAPVYPGPDFEKLYFESDGGVTIIAEKRIWGWELVLES